MTTSQPDFTEPLMQDYPTINDAVSLIMEIIEEDHRMENLPDHPRAFFTQQQIQEAAPTLLSLLQQENRRNIPETLTNSIERHLTDIAWDTYRKLPQEEKNALANALSSLRPPE